MVVVAAVVIVHTVTSRQRSHSYNKKIRIEMRETEILYFAELALVPENLLRLQFMEIVVFIFFFFTLVPGYNFTNDLKL
jgi:hypothetical protein